MSVFEVTVISTLLLILIQVTRIGQQICRNQAGLGNLHNANTTALLKALNQKDKS